MRCDSYHPKFPWFNRSQLTAAEFTQSRCIAEARIHVERAIERIKEFKVLQGDVECDFIHVFRAELSGVCFSH